MKQIKSKESLIQGIGVNDANYVTRQYLELPRVNGKRRQKRVWICPFYETWKSMIERCYSERRQEVQPYYKGCTVSDEWLTFSKFKAWMEKQEYEGNQLDKDLLVPGNKVYGPETCCFVSRAVNMFITEKRSNVGKYPTGVTAFDTKGKLAASCMNPFTKKTINIGLFTCPQEAHQAWLSCKLELARLLASQQADPRVSRALIDRYENYKKER